MTSGHLLIAAAASLLDLGMWAVVVVCQHAVGCKRGHARERLVILDFWFGSVGAPVGGCIAAAMVGLLLASQPIGLGLGATVLVISVLCTILLAKYWCWGPVVKGLLNIDIRDDGGLSGVGKMHFAYALAHFTIGWGLVAQALFGTGWTWCHSVAICGYCLVFATIYMDVRNGIQLIPDATFISYLLRQKVRQS